MEPARDEPIALNPAEVALRERYPHHVFDAQPPEYWCGRFTTVRDRFLSEQLRSESLDLILERRREAIGSRSNAVAARNISNPALSTTSTASLSARFVSNLAAARGGGTGTGKKESSIPAVPPPVPPPVSRNVSLGTLYQPSVEGLRRPGGGLLAHSNTLNILPSARPLLYQGRQQEDQRRQQQEEQEEQQQQQGTIPPQPAVISSQILASRARREAILLEDDDARCRRVLVHLENLCVTNEARLSLRQWRIDFARSEQSEAILPPGAVLLPRRKPGGGGNGNGDGISMGKNGNKRAGSDGSGSNTGPGFKFARLFGREKVDKHRSEGKGS